MLTPLDATPAVRGAFDEVFAAVDRLTRAVASSAHSGAAGRSGLPVRAGDDAVRAEAIACDAGALAALQALEAVEAALHVQRAQLLVTATGERPEVLNSRVPQDPTRDCRVSDIRALELAAVMGCTPNRARTLAYEARVLVTEVPQVLEAVRRGQATPYQSRLAAGAWRDLVNRHEAAQSPMTPLLASRFQTRVLRRSATQTSAEFKRTLATAVAALSPSSPCDVPDPRTQRHVTLQPDGNGMAWLTAYLDIVAASRVMQVLDHAARNDRTLCGTMAQRAADALVAIVDGSYQTPPELRSQAAEVQVLVSLDAMRAAAEALAMGQTPECKLFGEIAGTGHVVEGQALLELFGDARFRRLVVCPESGRLLDFGRETYRPPTALRDHVRGRDRTCRAPGCSRPARYADVDHTRAWEHGGPTDAANLATLCRTHHVLKTHAHWQYLTADDGSTWWQTPSGLVMARAAGEYLDHIEPPPRERPPRE